MHLNKGKQRVGNAGRHVLYGPPHLRSLYFRFSGKMVTSTYRAIRPIDQDKDK